MRLVTTKAFRARLSEFARLAETETVYVLRPGNQLLKLSAVPDGDKVQILRVLGDKENELKSPR